MTRDEASALKGLTDSIKELTEKVDGLDVLAEPEVVRTLKKLVDAAPALIELAEGYKMAGKAGNGIKWIAGLATSVVALVAVVKHFFWGP